ncbi:MAG: diguanylate cyclase [Chloroflexi bacterium]|nr:diguanylate cyclase [Chloroflexota bacterium]
MRDVSAAAQTWICSVIACGAVAVAIGVLDAQQPEVAAQVAQPAFWLLLIGASIAHAFPVIAPRHQAYHATQAFLMASVLVLSWPAVVLIVIAAHIAEWLRRPRPAYIQLYNVGCYLIAAGAAFGLLERAGARPLSLADPRSLVVALIAAGVMLGLNHGLTAIVLWLARGIRPRSSGLLGIESLGLDGLLLVVGIGIGGGLQLQPFTIVVTASPLILIYRALRVANVESTSHRDPLSGLYNARHLEEALDLELRRARASAHASGLIVAVVDDLPSLVERYGRAMLDFSIVAIADRLHSVVREFDLVARLDEGSIGIVVPGLGGSLLGALARRITDELAARPYSVPTTREPVGLTVSAAYASVASDARTDAPQVMRTVRDAATRAALVGPRVTAEVHITAPGAWPTHNGVAPQTSNGHVAGADTASWTPPRDWLGGYEVAVIGVGLALAAIVLATNPLPDLPLAAGVLGLVALSELLAFELYDRSSFSVSFAPIVAAGLLGGPAATLLAVCAVAVLRGALRRSEWHRVAFNASAFTLTGVPAMILATAGGRIPVDTSQLGLLAIGSAAASTIYYLHTFLITGAVALDLGTDPRAVWSRNYRWLFPHYVVLGWMGLGLAVATVTLGPLGTALFVAPPLAMRVVIKQYVERTAGAVHRLEAANADLRAASDLLRQHGEELSLLSDLGQLTAMEPRTETLPPRVVERCVPALGELCAIFWQSAHGMQRSVHGVGAPQVAARAGAIQTQPFHEVLSFAERVERGYVSEWIGVPGGTWLAAQLLGADHTLGWLVAWTSATPGDDERSRRLGLMQEVAQRVALMLERDALLEESAELEALRTVDRAKSDFIATTAHELRTPLTSLQGYTELLRTPVDPTLRDRWLNIVQVEAAQLGQVVDQLLDVSRLDSGRFQAERREFELREIVARVVEQFGPQAALTAHSLAIEIPDSLRVFADPAQVERVLRNLVSNAIKYSPGGGLVAIAASERLRREVEVCVADAGLGIPADWLGRLFERFQRVERPERDSIRGTGLGLYIARQLVELNAGRIWATSDGVGQGSTFHFTLPRAPSMSKVSFDDAE